MRNDLVHKKIIVTGASGGIGKQLCLHIAKAGGIPIMLARSADKLAELQLTLKNEFNRESYIYVVDLQEQDQVDYVLQNILLEHQQVHALINNAGIGVFDPFQQMDWTDIRQMFQLNVYSAIRLSQLVIPHFQKFEEGHIVNIASQAAKIATPKSAAYGASKHAILGFTNTMRQEIESKNIFVTAVNLGPVRTDFFSHADKEGSYQRSVERYMLNPDRVAKVTVSHLFSKKREINMPFWMEMGSILYRIFPGVMEKMLKSQFNKK
ncbi:SDR family NAD(P)-dependent oxidoreductase [Oceanobacillus massiliensis]|uniref:SDR family NAD(P)-dependent oxidoreductase n=1 Tax=Oceanobacillus massiliensis TaxID=1465765 RepID=UPI00028964DE|nr:SDR family oxidoreductase [Oceanobacillus massiliensis]